MTDSVIMNEATKTNKPPAINRTLLNIQVTRHTMQDEEFLPKCCNPPDLFGTYVSARSAAKSFPECVGLLRSQSRSYRAAWAISQFYLI